uniref:Accessory movement protein n=1 Tax=Panicum mosaic virus TaxID=40279 RepID=A0A6M3GZD6_9TOMB|nr:Accessory movement protein [Panicum mosaic virus]
MELPLPEDVASVLYLTPLAVVREVSLWSGVPPPYSMLQLWARPSREWAKDKVGRSYPTRKSYFKSTQLLPRTQYRQYLSYRGCLCLQEISPFTREAHHTCVRLDPPSPSTDGEHSPLSGSLAVLQQHREIWF